VPGKSATGVPQVEGSGPVVGLSEVGITLGGVELRGKNHCRMPRGVRERAKTPPPPPCWLKVSPNVSGGPRTPHPEFSPVVLTQEVASTRPVWRRWMFFMVHPSAVWSVVYEPESPRLTDSRTLIWPFEGQLEGSRR